MVTMFIDTLQPPFYEKMVRNVLSNFSVLVIIGERIEVGVRNLKIAHMGEANAIVSSSLKHNGGTSQGTSNYQPHFPPNTPTIAPQPYTYLYLCQTPYQTQHRPPYQPMPSYHPPPLPTTLHQNTQVTQPNVP
ncbi:hypothetical protein CR513_49509, partial [Mucuna pruriens]